MIDGVAAATVGDAGAAAAGADVFAIATCPPVAALSIAACWATQVVAAMGQPTPAPFKFWRVTAAALNRALMEAVELSVGKEMGTVGLLMTFPALRLFASSCELMGLSSV